MIALAKASAISLATTAMDLSSVTDLLSKNGVNSLYH
jgi:hypothetical protein